MVPRSWLVVVALALWSSGAAGQSQGVLRIRVTLPDADGKPVPVARHRLLISDNPATAAPRAVVTSPDGSAVVTLPPGNYTVESEDPFVVAGQAYTWWKIVDVAAERETLVELTAADAEVETPRPAPTASDARSDEGTSVLAQWQDAAAALWMPTRHATGFLVDRRGLVATSQRAVGDETKVAVQFSPSLKVAGTVIAAQPGRDVAIVRVDPAALGSVAPVTLGCETTANGEPQKGQKVFAIDTPLRKPKVAADGVLGRVGPHSLETDLDLESATAGGPVFAADGTLLGLTSIVDGSDERRPSYRVIRRADICAVLASAEKAMATPAPPGTRLPVEPAATFPRDALETAASRRGGGSTPFQTSPTIEVALLTPVRVYAARNRVRPKSLPSRGMRNQAADPEAIRREEGLFDFGRWADYFADFPRVLIVRVTPRLKEGFWTMIARGAAQTQGVSLPAMRKVTSGFSRLQAFCDQTEVQPIQPFVLERELSPATMTTEGLYVFDPSAIGPTCRSVKLVLYSEKSPDKGETLVLDATLLRPAWEDFTPSPEAR